MCITLFIIIKVRKGGQANNIGITSAFIDNFIFSDPLFSFVCVSLATFFCNVANISLRI